MYKAETSCLVPPRRRQANTPCSSVLNVRVRKRWAYGPQLPKTSVLETGEAETSRHSLETAVAETSLEGQK